MFGQIIFDGRRSRFQVMADSANIHNLDTKSVQPRPKTRKERLEQQKAWKKKDASGKGQGMLSLHRSRTGMPINQVIPPMI